MGWGGRSGVFFRVWRLSAYFGFIFYYKVRIRDRDGG